MTRLGLALFFLIACGETASAPAPVPSGGEVVALEALAKTPPTAVAVSSLGGLAATLKAEDDGFTLSVGPQRGAPRLTKRFGDKPTSVRFAPSGKRLAFFLRVSGGHELHVMDVATGSLRTPYPSTTDTAKLRWSPSGDRVAMVAKLGTERRIVLVDPDGVATPTELEGRIGADGVFSFDTTGSRIALIRPRARGRITLVDIRDNRARTIRPISGGFIRHVSFCPGGDKLVIEARKPNDEWFRGFVVDTESGAIGRTIAAYGDVRWPRFAPDGERILFHRDRGGLVSIHLDHDGEVHRVSRENAATHFLGWADGDKVAVLESSTQGPPRVVALALDGTNGSERAEGDDVAPTEVEIRGKSSSAWAHYWKAPGERLGAIIIVHGGPRIRMGPSWNDAVQLALESGFDVIGLNYRGSSAYGTSYARAGSRAAAVADIAAARDFAIASDVPSDNIVIVGESHGATLAMAASANDPRGYGVVVLVSPVANAIRRLNRASSPSVMAFLGERDRLSSVADVRAALEESGRPFDLTVLAGEGHGIRKASSRAQIYGAIIDRGYSRL